MKFFSSIYLPELKEHGRVSQLSFSEYYELNKFIQNDVNEHICAALDDILKTHVKTSATLTYIDRIIALLFMRIISVGPKIEMSFENTKVSINLPEILQKISNINIPDCIIKLNNDVSVTIKTPSNILSYDVEDFLYSTTTNGKERILSSDEKGDLFQYLAADVVSKITAYSENIEGQLQQIKLPHFDDVVLSLKYDILLDFIKMCFKTNLYMCLQKNVIICNYTKLSSEFIQSIPPVEVDMLISYIEADNKKNAGKMPQSNVDL